MFFMKNSLKLTAAMFVLGFIITTSNVWGFDKKDSIKKIEYAIDKDSTIVRQEYVIGAISKVEIPSDPMVPIKDFFLAMERSSDSEILKFNFVPLWDSVPFWNISLRTKIKYDFYEFKNGVWSKKQTNTHWKNSSASRYFLINFGFSFWLWFMIVFVVYPKKISVWTRTVVNVFLPLLGLSSLFMEEFDNNKIDHRFFVDFLYHYPLVSILSIIESLILIF